MSEARVNEFGEPYTIIGKDELLAATAELDRRAKRNSRLSAAGDEIEQSLNDYRRDLKNFRYVPAHAEAENLMRIIERVLNG